MATRFFTADTHWGHGGALGLFRRPFAGVPAMDAALEAGWNAQVGPDDEVWHLGDVAVGWPAERVAALLDRLHGRKHLVPGNNDPAEICALPGWASVRPFVELSDDGLVLCHYALRHWRNQGRGWINLHGHSHGRLKPLPRQYDVGVDCRGFAPVTLEELRERRPQSTRTT